MFLFDKRTADKLHKPRRKETISEMLRHGVRQLERCRHPRLLHVLHSVEETADTLAFATEAVVASLANCLNEVSQNGAQFTTTAKLQSITRNSISCSTILRCYLSKNIF